MAVSESCFFCESRDDLEEHHIIPQRFNGPDRSDNTVVVCHDCHWKLERLYNVDFYKWFGIDDPKGTQETHHVCSTHQCTNQAVQTYRLRDGSEVYRCEEHYEEHPGNPYA